MAEIERVKHDSEFWSTWANEADFSKVAKKKWDEKFLILQMDKMKDMDTPVNNLKTEITTLQGQRALRP